MVDIGTDAGHKVTALLSDMGQPLGAAMANALEVREAIDTLRGSGPPDLRGDCLTLAREMLLLGAKPKGPEEARSLAKEILDSGQALAKSGELVEAQGGERRGNRGA